MQKTEFIKLALKNAREKTPDLSQGDMDIAFSAICKAIGEVLLANDEITLPGLGKLKVKETAARTGRNPRTGEVLEIPAGRKVVFAPGKEFKEKLG